MPATLATPKKVTFAKTSETTKAKVEQRKKFVWERKSFHISQFSCSTRSQRWHILRLRKMSRYCKMLRQQAEEGPYDPVPMRQIFNDEVELEEALVEWENVDPREIPDKSGERGARLRLIHKSLDKLVSTNGAYRTAIRIRNTGSSADADVCTKMSCRTQMKRWGNNVISLHENIMFKCDIALYHLLQDSNAKKAKELAARAAAKAAASPKAKAKLTEVDEETEEI